MFLFHIKGIIIKQEDGNDHFSKEKKKSENRGLLQLEWLFFLSLTCLSFIDFIMVCGTYFKLVYSIIFIFKFLSHSIHLHENTK